METKVNYTIVGMFVTVLFAVIIIISLWLTTGLDTQNYKTYLVFMNESVAGLSIRAPVKYNGVTVGNVKSIKLNLKNPQQVILTLDIEPNIPITETTTAILMEQGITGIAYIGLATGEPAPLIKRRPGENFPVIPSRPSFLMRLDLIIQKLSDNLSKLSNRVNSLLNDQNLQAIHQTLQNLQKVSGSIAANSHDISESLKDFKVLTKNSADASKQLPHVMQSFQRLSEKMIVTSHLANKTLKQSNVAIESFSNDILPETYTTIKNINKVSKTLNGLGDELSKNPSMLIRGKTPPKAGPGE